MLAKGAQLLLLLVLSAASAVGMVLVWLFAMALLPASWQLPATLVIALLVLVAVLNLLERPRRADGATRELRD